MSESNRQTYIFAALILAGLASTTLSICILAIGFALFAISHGSFDFLLLRLSNHGLRNFVVLFLSIALGWFLIENRWPDIAFGVFLLLSAYHFGSEDFELRDIGKLKQIVASIFLGLSVLAASISPRFGEACDILQRLGIDVVGYPDAENPFLIVLQSKTFAVSILTLIFAGLLVVGIFARHREEIFRSVFLLLSLTLMCFVQGPIVSFSYYFLYWHSMRAFNRQRASMDLAARSAIYRTLPTVAASLAIIFAASAALMMANTRAATSIFSIVEALVVGHILTRLKIKPVLDNLPLLNVQLQSSES